MDIPVGSTVEIPVRVKFTADAPPGEIWLEAACGSHLSQEVHSTSESVRTEIVRPSEEGPGNGEDPGNGDPGNPAPLPTPQPEPGAVLAEVCLIRTHIVRAVRLLGGRVQ
ncbi:hypothetical protein OG264_37415 [Streptomyces xanthophaeus]|uniref:hypothetical protein n=1 Tax=Streptomyces xanthophaeus TaxID=67385 RepID=UPI0038703A92|nr:hypothetical protein OG264_37415 [Streptomyces xanthophaeus]WST58323.1 hypothetical protein OG605_01020 [Streptomyces xanthophaeus]